MDLREKEERFRQPQRAVGSGASKHRPRHGTNATNFSSTGSCPFPLLPVLQAVVASQSPAHLALACRVGAGTVPAAYSSCSSQIWLEQGLTWRHSPMG